MLYVAAEPPSTSLDTIEIACQVVFLGNHER